MIIEETGKLQHWNYFLALEADVAVLSRYIEFSEDNFTTYSLELAHLLLTSASEVDVVAKQLCKRVQNNSSAERINEYREVLNLAYPNIKRMKVSISRHRLTLTPWENWQFDRTPDWWSDHNDVKHERNLNFKKANLKNALNSMAGLYIMLLHLYKDEAENSDLFPDPNFFMITDEFISGIEALGTSMRISYNLQTAANKSLE